MSVGGKVPPVPSCSRYIFSFIAGSTGSWGCSNDSGGGGDENEGCSSCLLMALFKVLSVVDHPSSVHRGALSPLHSSPPWAWGPCMRQHSPSTEELWFCTASVRRQTSNLHSHLPHTCILLGSLHKQGVSHISWVVQMPFSHFLFCASGLWT